jgi:hypothetical protein
MSKSSIDNETWFLANLLSWFFPTWLHKKIYVERRGPTVVFSLKDDASLEERKAFESFARKHHLVPVPYEDAFYLPTRTFTLLKQRWTDRGV